MSDDPKDPKPPADPTAPKTGTPSRPGGKRPPADDVHDWMTQEFRQRRQEDKARIDKQKHVRNAIREELAGDAGTDLQRKAEEEDEGQLESVIELE
ncbi:MAG: hypothetical protein M3Z10_06600, partial [Gemmatimonadota bacterium]|nr:hypothetical protein [Gemmatimonadota bacterium]